MTTPSLLLFMDCLHLDKGGMEMTLDPERLSEQGRRVVEADHRSTQGIFPDISQHGMKRSKIPFGVKVTVEKARKSAVWEAERKPWEGESNWVTVIREGGRYRCWYQTTINQQGMPPPPEGGRWRAHALCYAESEDGFSWSKPRLGSIEWNGSAENNIATWYGYEGAVFRDDAGPPEERYKCFDRERMGELAAPGDEKGLAGLYVAVSPDGYRWKRHPERVISNFCDTHSIGCWDAEAGKYVGYVRHRLCGRAIGRTETDDFRDWPEPQVILYPGPEDDAPDDYYTNGFTAYPGLPSLRLLFSSIYHRDADQTDTRLAISHDGRAFNWVSRDAIVEGPEDGESIYTGPNLVHLPDGRLALPYRISRTPHNSHYATFYRQDAPPAPRPNPNCAWAIWDDARLAGFEADNLGEFFTVPYEFHGSEIHVNAKTRIAGYVKVELWENVTGRHSRPLPGYTLAESVPVNGDARWAPCLWKGKDGLGELKGKTLQLRFQISCGKVFACRFA